MSTQEEELRPALRKLAQAVGLLKPDYRAFRIKYEELVDLLNPQFPGIGQLTSAAEVNALLENVTGGGSGVVSAPVEPQAPAPVATPAPAAAAPGPRKPGRPPKAKPVEEAPVGVQVVEAPVEDVPVPAPAGEKRRPGIAPRRPMAPAQAAPVVASPEAAVAGPVSIDLTPLLTEMADLRKRIDVVGQQSDLIAGSIKTLKGNDVDLNERVNAIVGALTFLYTHITGDVIGSIEEMDWSDEGG